jgi:hypothetical protein
VTVQSISIHFHPFFFPPLSAHSAGAFIRPPRQFFLKRSLVHAQCYLQQAPARAA